MDLFRAKSRYCPIPTTFYMYKNINIGAVVAAFGIFFEYSKDFIFIRKNNLTIYIEFKFFFGYGI